MGKNLLFFSLLSLFFFIAKQGYAQGGRVDIGKSYVNISKLNGGGTFNPGDTLEIRVTIAVKKTTSYTAIDSVQVFDIVPAHTTFINNSLRVATNQGLTYKGPFTSGIDADQGSIVGNNITINLGNNANGTRGGRIRSDTSKPSFYKSHCIMMACYRVRIDPALAYGSIITFNNGSVKYKMVTPNNGWFTNTFPSSRIILLKYSNACEDGKNISAASDSLGTFASGTVQNRVAPLGFTTTYIKQNISTGQPNDYYYAIVNNSSPSSIINTHAPMPESPALNRVFGLWDISGDHTSAANTAMGNPPVAPGKRGGYFVLVNASYNTDLAYQETLNNLCPNTYYEFSAWFRNLCPRCSCDSNGNGSGSNGFLPYPGNDSSGVRPNLSYEVDGLIYYTSGDIKYDRNEPWKKFGFTFLTGFAQNSAVFAIRNNSPGGGGNDWAIDDITIAHCGPSLTMNYNPAYIACKEVSAPVQLSDTIRHIYNSYRFYKWQVSNVGGTIWTDMVGPGTSGIGTPVLVNGKYQYVAVLPAFIPTYADSGKYFRVIVATTAANLNSTSCAYQDGNTTMLQIVTCGVILKSDFAQLKAKIIDTNKGFITWTTTNESDIDRYEIESSDNNLDFIKIGEAIALNIPSAIYNYTDVRPLHGPRYYRVKMIDKNGLWKLSSIVVLRADVQFDLIAIKNPFNSGLSLNLLTASPALVNIGLFTEKGQQIRAYKKQVFTGNNQINIDDLSALPNAIYFIVIEQNGNIIRRKLLKE